MGKSNVRRKAVPQPPKWFWRETDNCWRCKNRHGCNGCKVLKRLKASKNPKKGRK